MNITKSIVILTTLLSFNAYAETISEPTLTALIPKSYNLVESIKGDLNKDGQEDVVLLIKATDPNRVVANRDGRMVDRNRRGLIIALKKGDAYDLALKNPDCFLSENEDGGVYFAPELSIEIKKGNLLIQYSHGRYGYWMYNFRYQNADFELIGYDNSNNRGPVVETFVSVNLLSNKVLRRVNTNQDAEGGDERFEETWSKIQHPKSIKLAEINDFDELSIERTLGIAK